MLLLLILGLLIGALSVIFALQNIATITVMFLFWQVSGSLAVILLIATIAGMMITILVSVPEVIREHRRMKDLIKRLEEKDVEIKHYQQITNTPNTLTK